MEKIDLQKIIRHFKEVMDMKITNTYEAEDHLRIQMVNSLGKDTNANVMEDSIQGRPYCKVYFKYNIDDREVRSFYVYRGQIYTHSELMEVFL